MLELLAEVLSEEPENARALMLSGAIHDMAFFSGWTVDPDASLARAINFGRRAVQAAPTNAVAHAHLAEALLHAGQLTEAESHFRQALGLNPSNVVVLSLHASYLTHIGVYDCALAQLDRTRDLDPYGLNWIPWIRADVYFAMGDYSAVIATLEEIHIPFNNSRAVLAASYALVGRLEDARRTLLVFLTVAKAEMAFQPKSLDEWKVFLMRESSNARDKTIESLMAGLKLAGLEDVLLGDKNI